MKDYTSPEEELQRFFLKFKTIMDSRGGNRKQTDQKTADLGRLSRPTITDIRNARKIPTIESLVRILYGYGYELQIREMPERKATAISDAYKAKHAKPQTTDEEE